MCQDLRKQNSRLNLVMTLAVNFGLLAIMLRGLMRWELASRFALWKYLWKQGLIWVTLAAIAEVPALVLVWLNLSPVMNAMFLLAHVMILVIGATQMYRTLSRFTTSYQCGSSPLLTSHVPADRKPSCPDRPNGSYFTAALTISTPGTTAVDGHSVPDYIPMRRAPWRRR